VVSKGVKLVRVALFKGAYARGFMFMPAPVERRKSALKSVAKHTEEVYGSWCAPLWREERCQEFT